MIDRFDCRVQTSHDVMVSTVLTAVPSGSLWGNPRNALISDDFKFPWPETPAMAMYHLLTNGLRLGPNSLFSFTLLPPLFARPSVLLPEPSRRCLALFVSALVSPKIPGQVTLGSTMVYAWDLHHDFHTSRTCGYGGLPYKEVRFALRQPDFG